VDGKRQTLAVTAAGIGGDGTKISALAFLASFARTHTLARRFRLEHFRLEPPLYFGDPRCDP
jgi:hypothetical protein